MNLAKLFNVILEVGFFTIVDTLFLFFFTVEIVVNSFKIQVTVLSLIQIHAVVPKNSQIFPFGFHNHFTRWVYKNEVICDLIL